MITLKQAIVQLRKAQARLAVTRTRTRTLMDADLLHNWRWFDEQAVLNALDVLWGVQHRENMMRGVLLDWHGNPLWNGTAVRPQYARERLKADIDRDWTWRLQP